MDTSQPQPAAPLVIGIDAGATHTVAIADRGAGNSMRCEFGPANLQLLSDARLERHLRAIAKAMPMPAAVAIGMAGARTDADRGRVRRTAERVWRGVPCVATSDLETALMAAGAAGPAQRGARVLIVSGTGSCCLGRRADGSTERLGGWGHILGDRGSGYDIAVRAMRAVIQHADRTRQWPPLGQRFMTALVINEPHDLVTWVQAASKPDTANLARIVFDAAAERDPLARRVLADMAGILAADAVACASLVAAKGARVQFVLGGSVLVKQPAFVAAVRRRIAALWPRATVTLLTAEGAWGAVAIARGLLAGAHRQASTTAREAPTGQGEPFPSSAAKAPAADTRAPVSARPRRAAPGDPGRTLSGTTPAAPGTAVPSLSALTASPTEQRNPRSMSLDTLSIDDAVALMLDEDRRVPRALLAQRAAIAKGVSLIVRAFRRGGRLFYVGAGTSGRLGVLDASECPPTFNTPPDMVQGIIAGGTTALWTAIEGAEDDAGAGGRAIDARGVGKADVVVGIAASGRTPFVWGALGEARARGAATILLCFNPHVEVPRGQRPTLVIAPDVGPEILTGSTRLKAGTATKLVLNVFTTIAMVQVGKVKSNLMVDVRATNVKLRDRAVRITMALAGVDAEAARTALEWANWRIPAACERLSRTAPPRRGGATLSGVRSTERHTHVATGTPGSWTTRGRAR